VKLLRTHAEMLELARLAQQSAIASAAEQCERLGGVGLDDIVKNIASSATFGSQDVWALRPQRKTDPLPYLLTLACAGVLRARQARPRARWQFQCLPNQVAAMALNVLAGMTSDSRPH
jgi:hypothetical protein